ncbi:MAG: RNA polymerase sigma factor [Gemmatimonadales bacterium]|nr:MAG: RNA polymerase sigma factor [Gemmatimonadales bacterium]
MDTAAGAELASHSDSLAGEVADVALAAAGDGRAFERLYRSHAARVYTLARRMAGSERAEELTQDVFVRAWQKLHTFRGEAAFGTWLYRLALNVILGNRAVRAAERGRFEGDPDAEPVGKQRALELAIDFESAVERLPKGARQVFVLHDVEGFTHREIARMLGITEGTSKAQLHRARMMLRRHLRS